MPTTKIAVAVPTYRRREMLLQLIQSIPVGWSIFVSDNDSSLLPLEGELGPSVKVSHSPNLVPMFTNWNRALSLVEADCTHVFIPSDDDAFLPTANDVVEQALRGWPEQDVFVFGCDFFDEAGEVWPGYCPTRIEVFERGQGFIRFARGVDARMPGIMFRTDFLKRIGAFNERFKITAADSELIQRALILGTAIFVPEVIGKYRIWTSSLTHATLASDLWLAEVDLWTEMISRLLEQNHAWRSGAFPIRRYRDEIYLANLRAGMSLLRKQKGYRAAWRHLLSRRYPTQATISSQAKMLARMLLPV